MFTGTNVHVRNGNGTTNSANALGNLIVGYNESNAAHGQDRTGSHNIVVGRLHDFTSFAGLIAGGSNRADGPASFIAGISNTTTVGTIGGSIAGGGENIASGNYSTILGGRLGEASGLFSTIGGGIFGKSTGDNSLVVGGYEGTASGNYSVSIGGLWNEAAGSKTVVLGGKYNTAFGQESVVTGGRRNTTNGRWSVISGGKYLTTTTDHEWRAGSFFWFQP